MRKLVCLTILGLSMVLFSNCVTKQKYQELENQYKTCSNDLSYTTSEKINCENARKDLELEVSQLKSRVDKLKADTLLLSRRLRQSERDYAKARKDYDDLLNNFAELNMTNNAEVNRLLADLDKIKSQLEEREAELSKQSDELNLANASLTDQEARMKELQDILNQKDAEVKVLKEKVANALKGFEGSGLTVYEKNGKVYVSMDEKLLFASASWEVGEKGQSAIKELGNVLANDPSINVLIEGHTDNVPFKGSGQVKDNWDLSVMRATSVVKVLLKNDKIDPQRVSASGRSEFYPIDTDNTSAARAKNRRTEIILTPDLNELLKIIDNN